MEEVVQRLIFLTRSVLGKINANSEAEVSQKSN
jgi:hypothetical protein